MLVRKDHPGIVGTARWHYLCHQGGTDMAVTAVVLLVAHRVGLFVCEAASLNTIKINTSVSPHTSTKDVK